MPDRAHRRRPSSWFAFQPLAVKFAVLTGVVVLALGALVAAVVLGNARVADLLARRTVTWSKVKSHTTLMTPEHVLNREADARAGAVVAALHAGTPPVTGPGWTGQATQA